jgi:hypothetical protein
VLSGTTAAGRAVARCLPVRAAVSEAFIFKAFAQVARAAGQRRAETAMMGSIRKKEPCRVVAFGQDDGVGAR